VLTTGATDLTLDAGGAAAVNIGNTNATSISLCNGTSCDTINLGTNADADAINIGDNTDTLTVDTAEFDISEQREKLPSMTAVMPER